MTLFLLACAGLIVLSGLFYLLPQRRDNQTAGDNAGANLDWYRLRQTELRPEELEALEGDMALRMLEDDNSERAVADRRRKRLLSPPCTMPNIAFSG